MSLDVIIGLQRGDEGKGRFVDLVAGEYSIIARGNGGANAGHTVVPEGMEPLALHQVPSGIAYPNKLNIIGGGVYLDPKLLASEIQDILKTGIKITADNLLISDTAHLVLPHHVGLDSLREDGPEAQGSTKSGIAYVASDKYLREGVRFETIANPKILLELAIEGLVDLNNLLPESEQKSLDEIKQICQKWLEDAQSLQPLMADTVEIINDRLDKGEKVLAEGAQAYWLDINHGMYPAVTSSSTTVSGLIDGLGVSAKRLGKVTGVAKAVKSHVGGGPMVTEVEDQELADKLRGPFGQTDSEYGKTTRRPRRMGYPDLVELKNAVRGNGLDEIALSKLDHVPRYGDKLQVAVAYDVDGQLRQTAPTSVEKLSAAKPKYQSLQNWTEEIGDLTSYDQLPDAAKAFVEFYQENLGVPITKIGVGPNRNQVIHKSA